MENNLPMPLDLRFEVTGVFNTDYIFDFDTIKEENENRAEMLQYLRENHTEFEWIDPGESMISGFVDNYSPPKVSGFLKIDITKNVEKTKFTVKINENKYVDCEISEIKINIYNFNCGVFHYIFRIPKKDWQDKETLTRLRFFIQKHVHDDFDFDMESILGPTIEKLRTSFMDAVMEIEPPLLETPFMDFSQINEEVQTQIFWEHATLVLKMPANFKPEDSKPYHDILLNLNPEGIQNQAKSQNIFAYVESGDSLICIPDVSDIRGRTPEQILFEDWIQILAIQHYTWKIAWELDRGFYVILNLVVSSLKNKNTENYQDVYAVSALINHIWLVLNSHEPQYITTTYYSIYFAEMIRKSWRTDEFLHDAQTKMDKLKELIGQLDEIQGARLSKRADIFLNLLGVFALGSLVIDYFSIINVEPIALTVIIIAFIVPIVFSLIMYNILKK